jgi:hypothetical protein
MATPLTLPQQRFVDRFLFEDPQGERPRQLREAYRLDALAANGSELDKLLRLAEWTYGQFYLFGRPSIQTENALEILDACAAGHTFYCAHYAIVFCAAATALGWVARPISVRRAEENYRLSNHNIVEVWSKELRRWVCFEPTYGGLVAIEGQPVSAYEAARQWFARDADGLQVILGPRRQVVTKADFPYLLRKYPNYGWTRIDERSFTCYACLAWVPTNRLLGQHAGKSIENWDHWDGIYVYFGAERGWREDPRDLPPYYPVSTEE